MREKCSNGLGAHGSIPTYMSASNGKVQNLRSNKFYFRWGTKTAREVKIVVVRQTVSFLPSLVRSFFGSVPMFFALALNGSFLFHFLPFSLQRRRRIGKFAKQITLVLLNNSRTGCELGKFIFQFHTLFIDETKKEPEYIDENNLDGNWISVTLIRKSEPKT